MAVFDMSLLHHSWNQKKSPSTNNPSPVHFLTTISNCVQNLILLASPCKSNAHWTQVESGNHPLHHINISDWRFENIFALLTGPMRSIVLQLLSSSSAVQRRHRRIVIVKLFNCYVAFHRVTNFKSPLTNVCR